MFNVSQIRVFISFSVRVLMLTMHLWNCSSWLMPVKLPVLEESLVWLSYTVELCFTVESLLISSWMKTKYLFSLVLQVSFPTCHTPSRLKWTKEDPFHPSWLHLLCVEQVQCIVFNYVTHWSLTSKAADATQKYTITWPLVLTASMGSYDQHASSLFCYNNNMFIAWLNGFYIDLLDVYFSLCFPLLFGLTVCFKVFVVHAYWLHGRSFQKKYLAYGLCDALNHMNNSRRFSVI